METLRDYEIEVIRLLASNALPAEQLQIIIRDTKFVSYGYTGCGYFLTISHPLLPKQRIVCSEPLVVGRANDIISGFIIFLENNELTLECHDFGEPGIPRDFRDKNVQVSIEPV